jgi:hypothetical protein
VHPCRLIGVTVVGHFSSFALGYLAFGIAETLGYIRDWYPYKVFSYLTPDRHAALL